MPTSIFDRFNSFFDTAPKQTPSPSQVRGFDAAKSRFDELIGVAAPDIKSIVTSAAKRNNVPEDLALKMSGAESNNNPNVTNRTGSSAKGLFQFIDSTWKGMGGKDGEQFDPVKNAELGTKYIRQNIDTLHNKLGRDIGYHEAYAAHFFGPGVSNMIARARPDAQIQQGLATFNSPAQVRRIMQQNPNLRGKTVGQVMQGLRQKTGEGVIRRPQQGADASDTMEPLPVQTASADNYEQAWDEFNESMA